MIRKGALLLGATLFVLGSSSAFAQEDGSTQQAALTSGTNTEVAATPQAPPKSRPKALSMSELLKRVEQGWNSEREENRVREIRFEEQLDAQSKMLERANASRAREEARSERVEREFEANELALAQLEETRRQRLGALGELFGVVRQVAGDTNGIVQSSLVSAQFPDRTDFLDELGRSKSLPRIESLEKLWFTLLHEMTELGKVTRFKATVVDGDGNEAEREVIRIGGFNAVSNGKFLVFENGKLQELPRQPAGTYLGTVAPFEQATTGLVRFALDPSRGSILRVLIETPDARERIEQGGIVGYAILALGSVAGVIAITRWFIVFIAGRRVAAQTRTESVTKDNALGRVLSVYEEDHSVDVETLELKLDEAIMIEVSSLDKLMWAVRVVSVVAPLMGLLGTVTGMIQTFQAITLFGTGDPKMMASGISEALVTTMLGLVVAIPLVLLHALVSNSSKGVVRILEQRAAGIIARKAERANAT